MTRPDATQLRNKLTHREGDTASARCQVRGPPEDRLLELIEEASRLTMGDAETALKVTALVVSQADDLEFALGRIRARRARARALAYAGRFEEALATCADAIRIAESAGYPDEAGRARLASMHALTELGCLDAAIDAGEAARATFVCIDQPALTARADINLGVVYQRADDPAHAVQCFDRARPWLRDDPVTIGHLDNNCGEALLALNDFDGAEAAFTRALTVFESSDAELTAAIAEGNLADLAVRRGQLARAMHHYERARRRLESTHSCGHLARLIAEQAEATAILGLPEAALEAYQTALEELDRCGLTLEAARARNGLGRVLVRLNRLADATTALSAAAEGFEQLGHRTARARTDLLRAEVLAANRRPNDAQAVAQKSLAVLKSRPADAAAARHLLARLALELDDPSRAEAELIAALAAVSPLEVTPLLADLYHCLGCVRRRQGRLTEAIADLSQAVSHVERVRGTLQADRFRAAFLGDRARLYEELVTAVLDQNAADATRRSFGVAEQCKSRSLLDRVSGAVGPHDGAAGEADDPTAGRLARERSRLRGELNALYSRLADDNLIANQGAAIDVWRRTVRKRERELETVEGRLASTGGAPDLFAPPAELDTVQCALAAEELLVEYFITDQETLAFVLTRDGASVYRHLADPSTLSELVRRVRFQIERGLRPGAMRGQRASTLLHEARHELAALYDLLVRPFADLLRHAPCVTIVPHGVLHTVPFAALFDGKAFLVEDHELRFGPSASVLMQLAARGSAPGDAAGCMVVGVGDELAPETEQEAHRVARMLDCPAGDVLIGDRATAANVLAALSRSRLIHIATHGHFSAESPQASGLRLSDRWLTARDVYGLRLSAELVTLSACETGVNVVRAGDELYGLARAFLAAGARSVLASLWRVHDESTCAFINTFYSLWPLVQDGRMNKAGALRRAQLEIMAHTPHPAFWAPFLLVGSP